MFRGLTLRARPGRVYAGPAAYVDGNGHPPLRAGYYALDASGKKLRRPYVRLVAVAREDGSHHYEVCRKRDPHQRPLVAVAGQTVELEVEPEGHAVVAEAPMVRCPFCNGRMVPRPGFETIFDCSTCGGEVKP